MTEDEPFEVNDVKREQLVIDKEVHEAAMALAKAIKMWRRAKGEYWASGSAREKETLVAISSAEDVVLDALEYLEIGEETSGFYRPVENP